MAAPKFVGKTSEADLVAEISRVITEITGVQLGEKQFSLVQGRLVKRMRELRLASPVDYAQYWSKNVKSETGVLVSLLTTHHTYFFREFTQFEHLLKTTLPKMIKERQSNGINKLRIWSAACSRGQEVYSLAMFLHYHLSQIAPNMSFEIVGSDVCEESVAIAKNGVYLWDELKVVPASYIQGHWTRGTGDIESYVRAKDSIRSRVSFQVVNLIELGRPDRNPLKNERFDIVFCRNVFIYFTREQSGIITGNFLNMMPKDGQIFIGLSGSLNGLELPLNWVGPSVYERVEQPAAQAGPAAKSAPGKAAHLTLVKSRNQQIQDNQMSNMQSKSPAKKIRVLCVDDSPTVLNLLARIFSDKDQFEIVGTAANGAEASEKAKALKPDVITLDIHMPEVSGVQYLETYHPSVRIPVVMVSSVSRDDTTLALRALELGASDYVEKPSVHNFANVKEELLFKVRSAVELGLKKTTAVTSIDREKKPPIILKPEGKLRFVFASFSSRDAVLQLLKGFRLPQPPTVVCFEGGGELLSDWIKESVVKKAGIKSQEWHGAGDLTSGAVLFCDAEKSKSMIRDSATKYLSSGLVLGPISNSLTGNITLLPRIHMIVEDRGKDTPTALVNAAAQVLPTTSFVYESDRFFAEGEKKRGEQE